MGDGVKGVQGAERTPGLCCTPAERVSLEVRLTVVSASTHAHNLVSLRLTPRPGTCVYVHTWWSEEDIGCPALLYSLDAESNPELRPRLAASKPWAHVAVYI